MSASTLASLQGALADIYDLPGTPDVHDFLLTDRATLPLATARGADEQLWVADEGDTVSLALYIDERVLERLGRRDPFEALTGDNLADYLTVAEGVSHFVYVAWNASHDKPVTLLELELQAEIDKYVMGAWLLRAQGAGRFPRELHRALFERAHVDACLAGERTGLYRRASEYAGRFCRRVATRLERECHARAHDTGELLAELRRFYRWSSARKFSFIENLG